MPKDFTSVARQFCNDPPDFIAERLAKYAFWIYSPDQKPAEEDKQELETLIFCARNLIIGLRFDEDAAELVHDEEEAERVGELIDGLSNVLDYLEEQRPHKRLGGPTPSVSRSLCAGVCADIWREQFRKVEPHSVYLWKACEAYWRACGRPPTPSDDSWEHYLLKVVAPLTHSHFG
jgi:hypothetical protein